MGAFRRLLETAPRYAQLVRSQYWPPDRLHVYQQERLRVTLAAAARIPFYTERFGEDACADNLRRLPILRRTDIESLYRSARSIHPPDSRFPRAYSSGTSGARAEFLFDRSHQRGRYGARARYLLANGWTPLRRSAWLVGAGFLSAAPSAYEDPQFVSRLLFGIRFISNSIELPKLAATVSALDPHFIYSYPSVLDGVLRTLESTGSSLPSLRRVFTGAELVEDSLRERVRRTLGVEISANYGSAEAFIAWQCPAGNYHQNAEHVLVELLDDTGRAVAAGEMGRVVFTTLENHLMPLIRYEIGDYAIAAGGNCACGRTLPLIGRIVGRGMNLFRASNGRLLTTWDLVNVLGEVPEITLFQIVQKTLSRIVVKYIAQSPLAPELENKVRGEFAPYLGAEVAVDFEHVTDILRTASGKFMVTLSEVAP